MKVNAKTRTQSWHWPFLAPKSLLRKKLNKSVLLAVNLRRHFLRDYICCVLLSAAYKRVIKEGWRGCEATRRAGDCISQRCEKPWCGRQKILLFSYMYNFMYRAAPVLPPTWLKTVTRFSVYRIRRRNSAFQVSSACSTLKFKRETDLSDKIWRKNNDSIAISLFSRGALTHTYRCNEFLEVWKFSPQKNTFISQHPLLFRLSVE